MPRTAPRRRTRRFSRRSIGSTASTSAAAVSAGSSQRWAAHTVRRAPAPTAPRRTPRRRNERRRIGHERGDDRPGDGRKPIQHSSVELATGSASCRRSSSISTFRIGSGSAGSSPLWCSSGDARLWSRRGNRGRDRLDQAGRGFGKGAVTVVDGSQLLNSRPIGSNENDRPWAFAGMRLHVLTEGWHYDLDTRSAMSPADSADVRQSLARAVK